MKYLIFDTETTGLPGAMTGEDGLTHSSSNDYPKPVEIAWAVFDEAGNEISTCCRFIRPEGFTLPERAARINSLSTEFLLENGCDEVEVLNLLLSDIWTCDVLVAHNIEYDFETLCGRLQDRQMTDGLRLLHSKPLRDTMYESMQWCAIPDPRTGGIKRPRLSELHRKLFRTDFENAHDALGDVKATARCFFELLRRGIVARSEKNATETRGKVSNRR